MQQVYDNNNFCSAGDIALALSRRFGRCQGNRKLKDGTITKSHMQMGAEFLMEQRKLKQKQKDDERIKKSIAFREFCDKAHQFADKVAAQLRDGFHEVFYENLGQTRPRYAYNKVMRH
jgi:hypothetical protein